MHNLAIPEPRPFAHFSGTASHEEETGLPPAIPSGQRGQEPSPGDLFGHEHVSSGHGHEAHAFDGPHDEHDSAHHAEHEQDITH